MSQKTKTHRRTKEEIEGPILFWGYKEQESNLILSEHDDDDELPKSKINLAKPTNGMHTYRIGRL
jgi:hypothetical protein